MSSRDEILASLKNDQPSMQRPPSLQGNWIRYEDPIEQFIQAVGLVGGRAMRVANLGEAQGHLEQLDVYKSAEQRCSILPELGNGNVDLSDIEDPHDLKNLDLFVAEGEMGVAENGAIWVTDEKVRHRVAYFICQHLVLVQSVGQLVHNMHESYDRLTFETKRWGGFISGPSKTADIEQSLVIGAHGPRSLHVFLVD